MPQVMKDIKRAAAKSRQIIAKNERQLEVKKEKTNDKWNKERKKTNS